MNNKWPSNQNEAARMCAFMALQLEGNEYLGVKEVIREVQVEVNVDRIVDRPHNQTAGHAKIMGQITKFQNGTWCKQANIDKIDEYLVK